MNELAWIVNATRAIRVVYLTGHPWLKENPAVASKDLYPQVLTDGCAGIKGGQILIKKDDEIIILGREKSKFVPSVPVIGEVILG